MEIQVGNKTLEVTLLSKNGNAVTIDIDGQIYDVDVAMLQSGTCSILHNGNSYTAALVKSDGGKHYRVNMNYSTYQIDMLDSQAKYMRMRKKGGEASGQSDTITAPMPCKIVKLYCKPGDKLKAGDTAMMTEAMKMQSYYQVSSDCEVLEVLVKEGDNVRVDQVLIKLKIDNGKTE